MCNVHIFRELSKTYFRMQFGSPTILKWLMAPVVKTNSKCDAQPTREHFIFDKSYLIA